MIEAVLFDLGDTIIDYGVGRREAEVLFRQGARLTYDYLESRGYDLPPFAKYFKLHYGRMRRAYLLSKLTRRDFSYADVVSWAAKKLQLPVTPSDLHHLEWLWYQPIGDASHIDTGIRQMLIELRRAGTKLAIVSNTFVPPHCFDRHLEDERLLEFFPVRIYSSSVRYRKPHPRIFEIALSQLGVHPSQALFIGDLIKTDIAGAKRAGMRTIWKPSRDTSPAVSFLIPPRSTPTGRHTPDMIIRKVTQLPDALHHFGWRPTRLPEPVAV